MNPLGLLIVALGGLVVVMGVRGSYKGVLELVQGPTTAQAAPAASTAGGSTGAFTP